MSSPRPPPLSCCRPLIGCVPFPLFPFFSQWMPFFCSPFPLNLPRVQFAVMFSGWSNGRQLYFSSLRPWWAAEHAGLRTILSNHEPTWHCWIKYSIGLQLGTAAERKITSPPPPIYSSFPPSSDATSENVKLMCIPAVWTAEHRSATLMEKFRPLSKGLRTPCIH